MRTVHLENLTHTVDIYCENSRGNIGLTSRIFKQLTSYWLRVTTRKEALITTKTISKYWSSRSSTPCREIAHKRRNDYCEWFWSRANTICMKYENWYFFWNIKYVQCVCLFACMYVILCVCFCVRLNIFMDNAVLSKVNTIWK